MIEFVRMPLQRYSDFAGRSGRREYWLFALAVFAVSLVVSVFCAILSSIVGPSVGSMIQMVLSLVICLPLLIPGIAVSIRRLHDQDLSGWFLLLGLVPVLGGLIVLVLMCRPGTPGDNRFGAPAAAPSADVTSVFGS